MLDGCVYGIDLNTLSVRGTGDESERTGFCGVRVQSLFCMDGDGGFPDGQQCDPRDESVGSEHAGDCGGHRGSHLPLTMDEDFVYGIARQFDIFEDAAGNVTFPMHQIRIVDVSTKDLIVQKTYEKSGYFVSSVSIEDYTMHLNRIQYNGTAYVPADQDMIMNREGRLRKLVNIATSSSAGKGDRFSLWDCRGHPAEKAPKLLTPKETILEEERTVAIKEEGSTKHYYVYVKGNVVLATDDVTEAVTAANDSMGVVIGDNLQYVWKRSRKSAQPALSDIAVGAEDAGAGSIAQCINAMLEKEGINISVNALIEGGGRRKAS